MSRHAVIDIGTNSMKMYAAEVVDGRTNAIIDRVVVTRLGEGLHGAGRISRKAMERNVATFLDFVREGRELGAEEIVAVGTMALRNAKNTNEFVDRVAKESGVTVEVIPGEEEARLCYMAVLSGLGTREGTIRVFDTGGGSTEFILGDGDRIRHRFSLNVGSRRPTEEFLRCDPVTRDELESLFRFLENELGDLREGNGLLVGMGGTVTSLGSVMYKMEEYDPDQVQGAVLPIAEVKRQVEMYRGFTVEERRGTIGLMPERADVILAGACIVLTVMKKLGVDELTVSDRGLRHGLMYDRFQRGE